MKPSQISNVSTPGDNHTGVLHDPIAARRMIEGTTEFGPTSSGGPDLIAENRIRFARKSLPVATMPPSPNVAVEKLPILDKLGARLAFERMGTRLYEAMISKYDAYGSFAGGPTRNDLQQIRDDEHAHMILAHQLVVQLGGDPTVVTPCANLQATASRGIGEILVDPRTNLIECLETILVAELTDRESWELLASSVAALNLRDLEQQLRRAEATEAEHLKRVRGWVAAAAKLVSKPLH